LIVDISQRDGQFLGDPSESMRFWTTSRKLRCPILSVDVSGMASSWVLHANPRGFHAQDWQLYNSVLILRIRKLGGTWWLLTAPGANLLTAPGGSWSVLASPGGPWRFLAAPSDPCSWRLLAALGGSWRLLAAPSGFWRLPAAPGGSWRPLAAPGATWRLLAAPGVSLWMAPGGLTAPSGSWRLLAAPLAALSGSSGGSCLES
jgi:hypothetical protein